MNWWFTSRESYGITAADDLDDTVGTVARFIEQLQANMSSPSEKELITVQMLGIARARKEARAIIGSHGQAMPLFISILRSGTPIAKLNVAAILTVLCKDEDLRLKVLLGGCIPPLLSLLESESTETRKAAAEAIFEVSSGGLSDDHVGMKIFVTEGVVPTLWEQLSPTNKQDKVVEGFVTGALRNLCGEKDGYWRAALEAGGVDIIVDLLSSDNAAAQSNAASLLARLMLAFSDSIPKVIDSGVVKVLLHLVGKNNDTSVRASAADALEALSLRSSAAKKAIVDANGVHILIGAVVAPSKECMQGEHAQALQGHATHALANICRGMSDLILYLGELSRSSCLAAAVADIVGALAYALMVFEQTSGLDEEPFDVAQVEDVLVMLLKPRDNKLVQDRVLEAMASLYGNTHLSRWLNHAEAKRVLIGLITMAAADVHEHLILYLTSLCCDKVGVWEAIGNREGIQLLISLLGLSSEQHQEYAVQLLAILTNQADDCKWAITAAGGIPPLVQLLETGSQKAREDAAHILWNLCCHSEDICACVESAGAVPAFLWLLRIGGPKGQEASAKALTKLLKTVYLQAELEDTEGIWISALLLAILFQDENVVLSPETMCIIPSLALLLRSEEVINRYFAAQAMASLVCSGSKEINLVIANSGAIAGLITLIGYMESDMPNLFALSKEFSLGQNPGQVILETLFEIEDVRVGSAARKSIPLLVDLLKPIPDRPGAPPIAVQLLTRIADGSDTNKLIMGEAGALDALTKYLSLSPQDSTEADICELLRILFGHQDLIRYEASLSSLNQLIAVLRLGSKNARFSAARALHQIFYAETVRDSELARQAVQPLVDMLSAASESEQEAALVSLIKLTSGNTSKEAIMTDVEGNPLESLYKILLSASSLELKRNAAQLCFILFGISKFRSNPLASECIQPLISLMQSDSCAALESGICAFERLLYDEQHVELAAAYDIVDLLVGLISGRNHLIIEASVCALIKLGKDCTPRKLDMVKAGVIDNCLEELPLVSSSLCSSIAELFRILTNNNAIARSSDAAKIVEPLFMVLLRPDFILWGQHSALQALVNILEKPQSLATLKLTPSQVIEPLISFLESPSQAIQQLGTELLTHLLAQEHFKQDITTKSAVVPLVQLAGIGILNLQQTAIKALEKISSSWPKAVADAGGIFELAKVIIQDDPHPPHVVWESAALVLSNVLRFNAEYYFKVPIIVLVKMLHSTLESTITVALNALIVHERSDPLSVEQMTEAGAIDALLDLLRSHQCEEASGRLLEALFNNVRVREMKVSKYAIAPLAQYLLDPQTRSESGRLLATLALGDLSQHEGHARASDSVSACRALVSLLEDQPTEDMKMVAICALQNFVMRSRTNRRAVAEAGGILVIQELLLSPNADVAVQAALLIKFLFSNHTLQEYVSNELIRSLTAALERDLWSAATINEEVLRTLNVIFANFPKLHISEAATLCIPHLIGALKSGSEGAQEAVLDTLCLLKHSWSTMPIEIAKSQSMIAAEAIPILQMLMKTCPPSFHERADNLLHCLPGCLTVTIKRGNNLKQTMGATNAFCRLTIGNGPSRQTKVVSHSTSPEWKEGFTWAFDVPPKGQKLHIICKSKNTFGKTTLGRVTIQIDKVVTEGVYSGLFSLNHDSNKDGSSRTLEIEIIWSNMISNEDSI
ncbi:hypothetical protein GOBAR_DD34244 [Gossypium barbadense]|nr:hypothetical protein GOBAR_DD34244 [Gossypium barbadense]